MFFAAFKRSNVKKQVAKTSTDFKECLKPTSYRLRTSVAR